MKCPNCDSELEQDMVDIGVGEIPCGPLGCPNCYWTEDRKEFDGLILDNKDEKV